MPGYPVIKAASFVLVHVPSILLELGTTVVMEKSRAADSKFLRELPSRLRDFSAAVSYPPNQVFIGNLSPSVLDSLHRPWYENLCDDAHREGKFGAIWPQDEFYAVMKMVDTFDLVQLTDELVNCTRRAIEEKGMFSKEQVSRLAASMELDQVQSMIENQGAAPLYSSHRLVGCVRRAHEMDPALRAHVMFENLAAKASGVLALMYLFRKNRSDPLDVEYLIECSEEAVGDMNQRGGGNLAKAVGEAARCLNATGTDLRAFCAGPTHALINAAALVKSGTFKQVVVLAGGSPAKLGMNSRDHVARGMPVLEDVLGAFALQVGTDDGESPIIRTDAVGRLPVASGSSPQAVMEALVVEPLVRMGLKISDVEVFAPELQNPEITIPAGAGDVPRANYRMIAALAVRRGEIERDQLEEFANKHGVTGYAPTQGHVPSGVPFLGPLREEMRDGRIKRAMVIGKGSLFLGRMTELFDGTSLLLEVNPAAGETEESTEDTAYSKERLNKRIPPPSRIGITLLGSELGTEELLRGAESVCRNRREIEVVLIGGKRSGISSRFEHLPADDEEGAGRLMEQMLDAGEIDAAVSMHYSFPIGIATVGRVITPGRGRQMFVSTTTGVLHQDRVTAMWMNAIAGLGVAKSCGLKKPTLGIVNLEGGPAAKRELMKIAESGYKIDWGASSRRDGGEMLRGNDLISGEADVAVADSLTGNVLMKMFSGFTTGGGYEAMGYGYGPGVGPSLGTSYNRLVLIISRASGAPVVAGAVQYADELLKGGVKERVAEEFTAAGYNHAVLKKGVPGNPDINTRPETAGKMTAEIAGIDVLELESALECLVSEGIKASSGMGCTGPVLLVSPKDLDRAKRVLDKNGYLNY